MKRTALFPMSNSSLALNKNICSLSRELLFSNTSESKAMRYQGIPRKILNKKAMIKRKKITEKKLVMKGLVTIETKISIIE